MDAARSLVGGLEALEGELDLGPDARLGGEAVAEGDRLPVPNDPGEELAAPAVAADDGRASFPALGGDGG